MSSSTAQASAVPATATGGHRRRDTHFWQSHLARKRPFQETRAPSGHLYQVKEGRPDELPHPFRLFPRPQDQVTSLWVGKRTRGTLSEYERVYPWAMGGGGGEGEEAHMGILDPPGGRPKAPGTKVKSVNDIMRDRHTRARRAWRELVRHDLLQDDPAMAIPTRSRQGKRSGVDGEGYIMVRADVLQEHLALERKLRKDRGCLKEQCTWYFTDANLSAREALPLVKIAVDEVCDREMAQAALAYQGLRHWRPHRSHPDAAKTPIPRLHGEDRGERAGEGASEEERLTVQARVLCRAMCMPVRQRFGYVTDLLTQIERRVGEKERDLMAQEDRLSRQVWRWWEAWERKKDYEIYYTLAHIFGLLSQPLFDKTPRPGKFYHDALSRSARSMQRMWRRYWPRRKRRKFRGAQAVQVRRRWSPIVKLRVKCGYHTALRYRFKIWRQVIRAIIGVREGFARANLRRLSTFFTAWSSFVMQEMRARKDQGVRLMLRIKRRSMKQLVGVWRKFAQNSRRIKTNFRRVMGNPYFKWWADYVDLIKLHKKELKLALICQALARGMFARHKLRAYRRCLDLFRCNILRLYCMKKYKRQLRAKHESMVLDHVASKQDKLIQPLIAKETARLDGLKQELDRMKRQGGHSLGSHAEELEHARVAVTHNYEASHPPPWRSPDPHHTTPTFILPEHLEQQHPGWAPLHFLLVDPTKVLDFYHFVARVYGTTGMLWTVNYWRSVEALRGITTTSDAFFMKRLKIRLLQIVDRYLSPNSVNPIHVSPEVAQQANHTAEALRRLSPFATGTQRLGAYGGVLQALYEGQFQAFLSLKDQVADQYWESECGRSHLAEVRSQKMARWKKDEEAVLANHRRQLLAFAGEMKRELKRRAMHVEEAVTNQAETVVAQVVDRVVDVALGEACATYAVHFNNLVDELLVDTLVNTEEMLVEGLFREAAEILIEEAFVEQQAAMIVDDLVFHIIAQEMVTKAMETGREQIAKETEDKVLGAVDRTVAAISERLIAETVDALMQEEAVVKIQCLIRSRRAKKKARSQVARHLVKVYDPTYGMYYYYNDLTGESSWTKPRIIDTLFPHRALTYQQDERQAQIVPQDYASTSTDSHG